MNYNRIVDLVKSTKSIVFDDASVHTVSLKGKADFVTDVDLKISSFLKEKLSKLEPDIGFMSEEEKNVITSKRWILDPIDGTTNLVYGYNMSSVSLALFDTDKVVFGVVYNPFTDEVFTAVRGEGAYLNGVKLPPAQDRSIPDCIIEFGAGATHKDRAEFAFDLAREVFESCLDLRRVCSSAIVLCYIAAGRMNGYFEEVLKPWDYSAASLIGEECGIRFSDWDGKAIQFENPSSYVCGTKTAFEYLLATIKKHMSK